MNRSQPVWTNQGVVKSGEMWNLAWIQIWDDEKVHRSIYCTARHSECPWSNAWRILFSENEQGGSDAKYGATFSQDGQQEAKRYQAWTHLFDALAECHLKNRLKSRIGTISKYQDYIRRVEDVCWSKNVLNETNIKKVHQKLNLNTGPIRAPEILRVLVLKTLEEDSIVPAAETTTYTAIQTEWLDKGRAEFYKRGRFCDWGILGAEWVPEKQRSGCQNLMDYHSSN